MLEHSSRGFPGGSVFLDQHEVKGVLRGCSPNRRCTETAAGLGFEFEGTRTAAP
jgi:hypothetical protein